MNFYSLQFLYLNFVLINSVPLRIKKLYCPVYKTQQQPSLNPESFESNYPHILFVYIHFNIITCLCLCSKNYLFFSDFLPISDLPYVDGQEDQLW